MAENSKIEWTTHTFNAWRGCTKVSPGCAHCYAETMSHRNPGILGEWGPNGTRVVASDSMWREPLKWNAAAAKAGERHRVFCASLADVFEQWPGDLRDAAGNTLFLPHDSWNDRRPWIPGPDCGGGEPPATLDTVRARLLTLIHQTPHLDWLLLTKRPEHVLPTLERIGKRGDDGGDLAKQWLYGSPMPNVWLGTSVENQAAADERIPHLLRVPARVRFLSCEPLLGPVRLSPYATADGVKVTQGIDCDWVIVGGESGPDARPMDAAWARSLRDQCAATDVPFFFKQWGDWSPLCQLATSHPRYHDAGTATVHLGKKVAGRLLDGREHNEVPTAEGERRCRECGINRPAGESNCPICLDARTRKTTAGGA